MSELLEHYLDPSWVADDCGGSRILCALSRADPRGELDIERLGQACVADAESRDEVFQQAFISREDGAAAWALELAMQARCDDGEDEDLELGDDAWIVIGSWEATVTGQADTDATPMPIHPDVVEMLRQMEPLA